MTKSLSPTKTGRNAPQDDSDKAKGASKLDTLVKCLRRQTGATIEELAGATGWQNHSVRGALAGTLKKKGHVISSDVVDGVRRYRIAETQE